MRTFLTTLALAVTLSACGGGGGETAEVALASVGDEMRYAQTEFTVAPGQTVHLVFHNVATSPAMRHNVVVLQQGSDVTAFGTAAVSAAATDYIPPAMEAEVIAHTPMSDPGETVEVTFTAPDSAGDYPFVCTFPGHFATMQGVMRVQG